MVKNSHTNTYIKMLEGLYRTEEEHLILKAACVENGIDFLSTPEGPTMLALLERIGVPAFKISSLNLVYYELLNKAAQTGKPIILSTGMANNGEIATTVDFLNKRDADIILLHCSSTYPTKSENANLRNIPFLRNQFGKLIGYSDHTIGPLAPIMAVSLGACVIEKHFTFDRTQEGADHLVAADREMLREMMMGIRLAERMLGNEARDLCDEEKAMQRSKRRKIIASQCYNRGDKVELGGIKFLQSKSDEGIDAKYYEHVIGRELIKHVNRDHIFGWEDFDE